jgi:hypothetical protein
MLFKMFRRMWSAISQPGTGGLIHSGDWRVIYPDGKKTRYLSYGDAKNLRKIFGGKLQWRHDAV